MTDAQIFIYPYLVSLFSFLLGAAALLWMSRRKAGASRGAWIKYLIYLGITQLILSAMIFGFRFFLLLACVIAVGIAVDLVRTGFRWRDKTHAILVTLTVCFILYIFNGEREDLLRTYVLVFCFDGYSQITGQLLGKRTITDISPNKTMEGLLFGALITFAIMLLFRKAGEHIIHYSVEVFLLITAAFMGDILASWRKRVLQIKDFGSYIPYHGGTIDRFDSLMGAYTMGLILKWSGY